MPVKMITNIEDQLIRDEGCKLFPYKDTKGLWTIGIGHLLGEVVPGPFIGGITQDRANELFNIDLTHVKSTLAATLPWFNTLDDVRQGVLINMGFNLGVNGLLSFHGFLFLMSKGQYSQAALDLQGTLVYKQLPERYGRLVEQLKTGQWT